MKRPEKRRALVFLAISIMVAVVSPIILIRDVVDLGLAVSLVLWIVGCTYIAIAKGYKSAWGLIGISCIGLVVLLFLRDKCKKRQCPLCKEFVQWDATLCKHCHSQLPQVATLP